MSEIFQKISFYKKIILVSLLFVLVAVVVLVIYVSKSKIPAPEQILTEPSITTPLPPDVIPGKLIVQTLPEANISLKFWTFEWGSSLSSAQSPNARTLQKVEVPSSASSQISDAGGLADFDLKDIPMNVETEIAIDKGEKKMHFSAVFDPYFGAVFVVTEEHGVLTLDFGKTEFAPGKTAGERSGPDTRKADQKVSVTILED